MPTIGMIQLSKIIADERCQQRASMDFTTIAEWAQSMRDGIAFPPLITFNDGGRFYLADGFTRLKAAGMAGLAELECEMREGTLDDAIVFSCTANTKAKGQRWTNADKRRAVNRMLATTPEWTDGRIAKHCATEETLVRHIRTDLSPVKPEIAPSKRLAERGGVEYEIDTSNIGSSPSTKPRNVNPTWANEPEDTPEQERFRVWDGFAILVWGIAGSGASAADLVTGCPPDRLASFAANCEQAIPRLQAVIDVVRANASRA